MLSRLRRHPTTESWEVLAGAWLPEVLADARAHAAGFGEIRFIFSGVTIRVREESDVKLLQRDYMRALNGFVPKDIGPFPPEVGDEVLAAEADQLAAVKLAWEERQAARRLEEERAGAELDASLSVPLALSNEAAWRDYKWANRSGYGHDVIVFAERWARLMQEEMAKLEAQARERTPKGRQRRIPGWAVTSVIHHHADTLCAKADVEGITGFQYNVAVKVLSDCWVHGDTLRTWHNLKVQVRNEGEAANKRGAVLNSALLSISAC